MGVKGFPTLKIIRPGKKRGQPSAEDYQGPRTAKDIVQAVVDKIPNHVERIGDKDIETWMKESNETAKAILFSNKGSTSPTYKALAIDFLGGIKFAQIRDKEMETVKAFGVKSFPTLILLPGGSKDAMVYEGELKKEPMLEFFKQVRLPNPDPAPAASKPAKAAKKGKNKKEQTKEAKVSEQAKKSFESASSSHATEEASSAAASPKTIVLGASDIPVGSPDPSVDAPAASTETIVLGASDAPRESSDPVVDAPAAKTETIVLGASDIPMESPDPVVDAPTPQQTLDIPPRLPSLDTESELRQGCLHAKATTCILALIPANAQADLSPSSPVVQAQAVLAEIKHRYARRQAAIFPFYTVPSTNPLTSTLRTSLALHSDDDDRLEIIAVNVRRGWWRRFEGESPVLDSVDAWIDDIRLGGDGKKKVGLPDGFFVAGGEKDEEMVKEKSQEEAIVNEKFQEEEGKLKKDDKNEDDIKHDEL